MSQVDTTRLNAIRTKAEAVAMGLIKNGLQTSDPKLAPLCKRLEKFKPMLAKAGSEAQTRGLLQNGLRSVKFVPSAGTSDDAEVLRLLSALVDKLGSMAGMLGLG